MGEGDVEQLGQPRPPGRRARGDWHFAVRQQQLSIPPTPAAAATPTWGAGLDSAACRGRRALTHRRPPGSLRPRLRPPKHLPALSGAAAAAPTATGRGSLLPLPGRSGRGGSRAQGGAPDTVGGAAARPARRLERCAGLSGARRQRGGSTWACGDPDQPSSAPVGMMKERLPHLGRRVVQGEDRRPKRVKEEEALEACPRRQEGPAQPLPGRSGKNGDPLLSPGQRPLESDCGEGGDEHRVGCGSGLPALGLCRAQLGETSHWCPECGERFARKADLENHQSSHVGHCSYICTDCGRSFEEHMAPGTRRGVCPVGGPFSPAGGRRRSLPLSSETVVPRKERKELSLQEKVRVLEMLEGPRVSQSELAKRFGVSQPQICRIIKNRERILAEWCKNANPGRKRKLEEKGAARDAALLQWGGGSCASGIPTNGTHHQGRGRTPPEVLWRPEAENSLGWMRLKVRQNGALGGPVAKRQNAERLGEELWETTVLPYILSNYDPPSIYTCGEAGILFKATPGDPAPESRGGAQDQLTVLLCTNLDASDKRDLLVVGKAPKESCFQGAPVESLPATYVANGRAWMTAAVFSEWLQRFNEEMRCRQRKVVLFLAQCGAHPHLELSHVQMAFISPGSAHFHPLEQGVVQSFKCHYRRRMLIRLFAALQSQASRSIRELAKRLTLLDSIHTLIQAWSDVSPEVITSGFRAAGFSPNPCLPPPPPAGVVQALGFRSQQQYEQFVFADDHLECFGDPEEPEGAQEVQPSREPAGEPGEEEDLPLPPRPSRADAMESLARLRRYLECHSAPSAAFQTFYQLEDAVHGLCLPPLQGLKGTKKE